MIDSAFKEELYEYITGIVQQRGHKMLAIGGPSNHIHIFLGLNVDESVSDLMQAVKRNSSLWINQNHKTQNRFEWQKGYGAFSYSKSHVNAVINYIKRQEEHHRKKAFREEYKQILRNFDVKYDEQYILQDV